MHSRTKSLLVFVLFISATMLAASITGIAAAQRSPVPSNLVAPQEKTQDVPSTVPGCKALAESLAAKCEKERLSDSEYRQLAALGDIAYTALYGSRRAIQSTCC